MLVQFSAGWRNLLHLGAIWCNSVQVVQLKEEFCRLVQLGADWCDFVDVGAI